MPPPDPARIWSLLGWRPGEVSFALPETTGTLDVRGMTLQRLRFAASHGESVPALFLPPRRDAAPAVLYLHAHGGTYSLSTAELTDGRAALAGPWLDDLAAMGAAVLCLEMPCFGSRADRAEGPLSKALLWHGRTLFGQMVAELAAGVDWLAAHPGIDAARIGCLGLSMGGTQAWWLAALERRIAAAVSLCAFSDLAELVRLGNHDRARALHDRAGAAGRDFHGAAGRACRAASALRGRGASGLVQPALGLRPGAGRAGGRLCGGGCVAGAGVPR